MVHEVAIGLVQVALHGWAVYRGTLILLRLRVPAWTLAWGTWVGIGLLLLLWTILRLPHAGAVSASMPVWAWLVPLLISVLYVVATEVRYRLFQHLTPFALDDPPAMPAVLTTTVDGLVQSWDHRAALMFGYSSAEAIGASLAQLIVPDRLRGEHDAMVVQALAPASAGIETYQTTRRHRDGSLFFVSAELTVLHRDTTPQLRYAVYRLRYA